MKKTLLYFLVVMTIGMFQSCKHPEDKFDPASIGGISGEFSISASKKVVFARGNLQYQASTGLWRFAATQYESIGEGNSRISSSYSGWIDLFGFATSGWDNGNKYYHPYDYTSSGVNSNGYGYGPTDGNGNYVINLVGKYANADWGVFNSISNGGEQAGLWRCLTNEEVEYLLSLRPKATSLRYLASVNGKKGLVILPDAWVTPEGLEPSSTSYTAEQWNEMEKAGAVFLPAAGLRIENQVVTYNLMANYWTSTVIDEEVSDAAYTLSFNHNNGSIYDMGTQNRSHGCSVRLVHDLK